MAATIAEAIRDGALRLRDVADNPRQEARLLLAHALGTTQNELIRNPERCIDTTRFHEFLTRRQAHEPIALILGHRGFWSIDLLVSGATLIPRPDSETLVRAALDHFAGRNPPARILDLGTGTGCLLLALLSEYPTAFGIGIDKAPAAASLARANAAVLGLGDQSAFACADWTAALAAPPGARFDLIVSNPPYIRTDDIPALMPDVALFEPRSALDGGADGCDAYRALLPNIPALLTPNGIAIMELGIGQAEPVTALARQIGLPASRHLDLGGIQRAILLGPPPG